MLMWCNAFKMKYVLGALQTRELTLSLMYLFILGSIA